MKPELRFPAAWNLAFLCLCFVVSELHEQAHIQTGYLLYRAYGPRDFNVWQTAVSDGQRWVATLAGPLFSYACMWAGLWWSRRQPGPGLALLFAGLPFARVLTAIMGGGDEKVVLLALSGAGQLLPAMRVLLAALVLLAAGAPVVLAMRRYHLRPLTSLLLLLLPLLVEFPLTHTWYNRLLHRGIGSGVIFGGTPWLIQLHFLLMATLLFALRKNLLLSFPARPAKEKRAASLQPSLIN